MLDPMARLFGGVQGIQEPRDLVLRCRQRHTSWRAFEHRSVFSCALFAQSRLLIAGTSKDECPCQWKSRGALELK